MRCRNNWKNILLANENSLYTKEGGEAESILRGDDLVQTLAWFLKWASTLAKEYGPILTALHAFWSLCREIYGLIVGRKPTQGQD